MKSVKIAEGYIQASLRVAYNQSATDINIFLKTANTLSTKYIIRVDNLNNYFIR